jgi:hypothetical protein
VVGPSVAPHQREGEEGDHPGDDQCRLDRGPPAAVHRPGDENAGQQHSRGEQEVVGQRPAEKEAGELAWTRVEIVVQRSPHAPQDERPAGGRAAPEQRATARSGAHETTTRVTHFVWLTPGRPGAMRRTG